MVINVYVAGDGQGGAASNDSDEIWRPVRFHILNESINEDDRRINEFIRTLRSLLNKLSPANFCKIVDKFKSLILDNSGFLDQAATFLVEKAITEPLFSKWYIELLCSVSDGLAVDEIEKSIPYRIRMLFVENLISVLDDLKIRQTNVQNSESNMVEVELQERLNETEFKIQRKFVGVGRVIAESFILGILSLSTLNKNIDSLLSSPEEKSLKCLCKLLTTVGKFFEFHMDDAEINEYFVAINRILDNYELSPKSRFMLQDIIEYRINSWTPRTVLQSLNSVEQILNALSELCARKEDIISVKSSESDFSFEMQEAQLINDMVNKFTQCPRNLAGVMSIFNQLTASEKKKLVKLFIMCVTKGDIYSDDCGRLFSALVQSKTLSISDVILGIKTVIHGYRKNAIFADQYMLIRLKEIFQPLLVDQVFSLSDLEHDCDVKLARKNKLLKKKQLKEKSKIDSQDTQLSWRKGPIINRDASKILPENENKEDESKDKDSKIDNDET